MNRIHLAVPLTTALLALAACGGDPAPTPSPSATSVAPSPVAAAPSPTPTPTPSASPSPTVDASVPLAMGKGITLADRYVTAKVHAYKQPVAGSAPKPDDQPGFVWGAAQVEVCATKDAPTGMTVSNDPWSLVYQDSSHIEPSSTGYQQFPEPEYPWGDKALAPGRCIKGWITFPVPGKQRPVYVEYGPEDVPVPPQWTVK
ncbi:hypothetical protein ACIBTV_26750 [Micromonospora sp. NPDC049366]|uniref:hypothetical protein n=1 Tax=Micromonospora sp. NPDC049366 TaxID=3364271 RepID=UPI00379E42CE